MAQAKSETLITERFSAASRLCQTGVLRSFRITQHCFVEHTPLPVSRYSQRSSSARSRQAADSDRSDSYFAVRPHIASALVASTIKCGSHNHLRLQCRNMISPAQLWKCLGIPLLLVCVDAA